MPRYSITDKERLLGYAVRDGECLIMQKRIRPDGYANFGMDKHVWLAHRASWTLHNGEIPEGMDVLHRCDRGLCIEPEHLFLGTDFDNQQDRVRKGRHAGMGDQKGECNYQAKLTAEKVLQIRAAAGPQTAIAAQFGVSQATVSWIRSRKGWAHVSGPAR